VAIEPHDAAVGVEQPQQQRGDRGLAAAARPDDRHGLPGATSKLTSSSTGRPRSVASETSSNASSPRTSVRASARPRLLHVHRRIQQFQHPAPRHLGGGQAVYSPISACTGAITRIW
jgi:hypothetical protein